MQQRKKSYGRNAVYQSDRLQYRTSSHGVKSVSPTHTPSEFKLRSYLKMSKIPVVFDMKIWYTPSHKYTPDLVVGGNLIVEVDGSIHNQEFKKMPDRIRQRALENMGYYVLRVKNEDIQNNPSGTADKIVQKFYEVTETKKGSKIVRLKPYPSENLVLRTSGKRNQAIQSLRNIALLDLSKAEFLSEISKINEDILTSPADLERILLSAFGIALRSNDNKSILDYNNASDNFIKATRLIAAFFGEDAATGMRNQMNISAPNFIKNLVFHGGPVVKRRIVQISSVDELKANIDGFNEAFRPLGVVVDEEDVILECCEKLNRSDVGSKFDWVMKLCDSDQKNLP